MKALTTIQRLKAKYLQITMQEKKIIEVFQHTSCRKEEEYVSPPICMQSAGKYCIASRKTDKWEDHTKCLCTEIMQPQTQNLHF